MPNTLESDPRFRYLSTALSKFLESNEGRLFMDFMDNAMPVCKVDKGMDTGALTGAYVQGWRDAIRYIRRLSVYEAPPPALPEAEMLLSDKIQPR